jgi:predicted CxxxxCH...CXXCH cytochrome family protein
MRLTALIVLGLATCYVTGCKDQNNPVYGDSPSNIVFPTRDVSYQTHVQPLFDQACNSVSCHGEGSHPSPLKLTDWGNTVLMTPGVVVIGKPDASTLVLRIQGNGGIMPPTGNPLNQNQINGIRTWIVEGAKNN